MSEQSLEALVELRRRTGAGRLDECWDGAWRLTDPTARHQQIAARLYRIFADVIEGPNLGTAWISINVTDREDHWIHNHRCPDGAVIMHGNPGRWIGEQRAAFLGGPDLVVEVIGDESPYEKFPFYGRLGVKEILIVDQNTSSPSLWRWTGNSYEETSATASLVTGHEFMRDGQSLVVINPLDGRRSVL